MDELERWYQRVCKSGYPDQCKWRNPRNWRRAPWKTKLQWIYWELRRVYRQACRMRRELKNYGSQIRAQYKVSLARQLFQQTYLILKLGIPLKHYRGYHLFKPERWARVDEFLYEHGTLQKALIERSFPAESERFDNKLSFFKHCTAHDVPTPPVIAVFEDGEVTYPDGRLSFPEEDLFVKELCGLQGWGVGKFVFQNGFHVDAEASKYDTEALAALLCERTREGRGLIVQPSLRNHEAWQPFTSGSLATVRIVTARTPDEEIIPLAASLRMPTGNAAADNFSLGGIASPVDLSTGALGVAITNEPRGGRFEFESHPDTGQRLPGTRLPGWDGVLGFAQEVHATFDTIFVGWDIARTTNGLVVIEGNKAWGPDVVESPQNRSLTETPYPSLYDAWMRALAGDQVTIGQIGAEEAVD